MQPKAFRVPPPYTKCGGGGVVVFYAPAAVLTTGGPAEKNDPPLRKGEERVGLARGSKRPKESSGQNPLSDLSQGGLTLEIGGGQNEQG